MRCPLLLIALAACAPARTPAPPRSSRAPAGAPRRPEPLQPVVDPTPRGDPACPLAGDELEAAAPSVIALAAWPPGELPDGCPEGFDAARVLAAGGCALPGCEAGTMRGATRAALAIEGPDGSGHFAELGLALPGSPSRFACLQASTVGVRALEVGWHELAPLPWLADVDGDGAAELVVWQRLPWGDAEVTNALFPIVYVLDGDRLVRRDDRARALRRRVAAVYDRAAAATSEGDAACFRAVAHALVP